MYTKFIRYDCSLFLERIIVDIAISHGFDKVRFVVISESPIFLFQNPFPLQGFSHISQCHLMRNLGELLRHISQELRRLKLFLQQS